MRQKVQEGSRPSVFNCDTPIHCGMPAQRNIRLSPIPISITSTHRSAPIHSIFTPISAPLNDAEKWEGGVSVQGATAGESAVSVDPMPCSFAGTTNIKKILVLMG